MNLEQSYTNKKNIVEIVMVIIVITIFLRNLIPFLQEVIPNYIILLFMFFWLFLVVSFKKIKINKLLVFAIWLLVVSIITLATSNVRFFKNYVYDFAVFLFPLLVYFVGLNDKKKLYSISKIIVFVVAISFSIYIYYIINNNLIFHGRDEEGYILAYSSVIFANIMLGEILTTKGVQKIKFFLAFLVFVIMVLVLGFAIALFSLVISVTINLTINFLKNSKQKVISSVLTIVIGISIVIFYKEILTSIADVLISTPYYDRINSIIELIKADGYEISALTARIETYQKSIEAFLKSPFIGVIWYYNDSYIVFDIVGYHSYVLDALGLFGGILGTYAIFLIFIPIFKMYKTNKIYSNVIIANLFSLIVILLFNNNIPALGVGVYFIMNAYAKNVEERLNIEMYEKKESFNYIA